MDGSTLDDECKAPRRAIDAAALALVAVPGPAEPGQLNGREEG